MGIVYVKTAMEMNVQNRLFYKRVKEAQVRILQRMAKTNKDVSIKVAETHKFTGELISTIEINQENVYMRTKDLKWIWDRC